MIYIVTLYSGSLFYKIFLLLTFGAKLIETLNQEVYFAKQTRLIVIRAGLRIRVAGSDPDPVFKMKSDPVFRIWLDPVFKFGRIRIKI